jgi:MarR family
MNSDHRTSQNEAAAAYTELGLIVLRLGARLAEAAERTAAAGGLTAARWRVLAGVLNEPRPVAEIARRMGLTGQSVQRLADALVRDGYAHWEPNPRHSPAEAAGANSARPSSDSAHRESPGRLDERDR